MIVIGGRYRASAELRDLGVKSCGENVLVHDTVQIVGAERISFGNHVRVDPFSILSAGSEGYLNIGSFIHIGSYCGLWGGAGIEMEDFSGMSPRGTIFTVSDDFNGAGLTGPTMPEDFRKIHRGKVTLGRYVAIASGVVILHGVHVGEGCSVGVNSLVRRSLEPWKIYHGTPAKEVRERPRETIERFGRECLRRSLPEPEQRSRSVDDIGYSSFELIPAPPQPAPQSAPDNL
jgi:acetyltransferase-like isoleucine patch superfamily enzyme